MRTNVSRTRVFWFRLSIWAVSASMYGSILGAIDFQSGVEPRCALGHYPGPLDASDFTGDGVLDIVAAVGRAGNARIVMLKGKGGDEFTPHGYDLDATCTSITAADLNRDDRPDIIAALGNADKFLVFKNNGAGSFGAPDTYSAFGAPFSLAAEDLDNDHDCDVAVAECSRDTLEVFSNDGTEKLSHERYLPVGDTPRDLIVADFDCDGNNDIAVANYGDKDVSILWGNGHMEFSRSDFYVGYHPLSLDRAELNGDGLLDIVVVTSQATGELSFLLNQGDGLFERQSSPPVVGNPCRVAVADFDLDGSDDIAVTVADRDSVAVLLGNGTDTPGSLTYYAVGNEPSHLAIADFDGNGTPDIAVANSSSRNISVLLGTGTGSFATAPHRYAGRDPRAMSAIAVPGTAPYSAVVNGEQEGLWVLQEGGAAPWRYEVGSNPRDLLNDCFRSCGDIVVANRDSNDITVLWGAFPNPYTIAATYPLSPSREPVALAAIDIDNDGCRDIVTANYKTSDISILFGDCHGGFSRAASWRAVTCPKDIAVADFNQDGYDDIALANRCDNTVALLFNDMRNRFLDPVPIDVGIAPSKLVAADFDGDGKADIAVLHDFDEDVWILRGDGHGAFSRTQLFHVGSAPTAIVAADFNKDAYLDLAVACHGSASVFIWKGVGLCAFVQEKVAEFPVSGGPIDICVADCNDDGSPDILSLSSAGVMTLLNATGRFTRGLVQESAGRVNISDAVRILMCLVDDPGACPVCQDAADVNDDGTIDIADPIYLLMFLFKGGTPPPEPFPEAGLDPTEDQLSCP